VAPWFVYSNPTQATRRQREPARVDCFGGDALRCLLDLTRPLTCSGFSAANPMELPQHIPAIDCQCRGPIRRADRRKRCPTRPRVLGWIATP